MAKIDKIKEEIGWLKVIFGLLVATGISLMGWLAQNYKNADLILIIFDIIGVIFTIIGIIYTNKRAMKKIDELEDL